MILALALSLAARAETANSLGVSPLGAFGFTLRNVGRFAAVYERGVGEKGGLYAEASFVHVHGDPTHLWTYGGQAGFRYHAKGVGEGAFFGVGVGRQEGFGKVHASGDHSEGHGEIAMTLRQPVSVTAHAGYRWPLGDTFALTGRIGTGYGPWTVAAEGGDAYAEELSQRALGVTPIDLDTELSFGVRF